MRGDREAPTRTDMLKLCTFYIGDHQFGVDILKVLEINKNQSITTVPRSHDFIVGVMNLRGRIVTVIDLSKKLGLSFTAPGRQNRTIIVHSQEEYIGLRVDRIGDVVPARTDKVEPPPVNIDGVLGKFTEGVLKSDGNLIAILDVEAVLA